MKLAIILIALIGYLLYRYKFWKKVLGYANLTVGQTVGLELGS